MGSLKWKLFFVFESDRGKQWIKEIFKKKVKVSSI